MMGDEIKVKCKRCQRLAKAEDFVLDPVYEMIVCPECIRERRNRDRVQAELKAQKDEKQKEKAAADAKAAKEQKPAGWDMEDEYLEKAFRSKQKSTVAVQPVSDTKVKYKCPKCGYQFDYDTEKRRPARCPYCSSEIYKFKVN